MLLFPLSAADAADCPTPITRSALEARLFAAESAYANLDVDRFTAAADALAIEIDCLDEPLTTEVAARIHRVRALLQWGDADEAMARRSLAAVKRLAPGQALPTDLVPAGHALHQALAQADATTYDTVPEPVDGTLAFDGTAGTDRPAHQPTIAQLLAADDVRWTVLLAPEEALPSYEAKTPAPVVTGPRRPPTRELLFVSGGSLVVAGGLYGGSWLANASFANYRPQNLSPDEAYARLEGKQRLADGLLVGSASLSAVAIGAAVAAMVTR